MKTRGDLGHWQRVLEPQHETKIAATVLETGRCTAGVTESGYLAGPSRSRDQAYNNGSDEAQSGILRYVPGLWGTVSWPAAT